MCFNNSTPRPPEVKPVTPPPPPKPLQIAQRSQLQPRETTQPEKRQVRFGAKKAKDEGIGKEKTVVEYVAEQIKTQGGDVAGVYVVDKSIVQVDTQGNIKQII